MLNMLLISFMYFYKVFLSVTISYHFYRCPIFHFVVFLITQSIRFLTRLFYFRSLTSTLRTRFLSVRHTQIVHSSRSTARRFSMLGLFLHLCCFFFDNPFLNIVYVHAFSVQLSFLLLVVFLFSLMWRTNVNNCIYLQTNIEK